MIPAPEAVAVSDEDLDAFVDFLEGGESGALLLTALAIAKDSLRTRALLREAREACNNVDYSDSEARRAVRSLIEFSK